VFCVAFLFFKVHLDFYQLVYKPSKRNRKIVLSKWKGANAAHVREVATYGGEATVLVDEDGRLWACG
jgi:hypothetical protein